MKFTLSWLKTHLETDASLAEITNTLTHIGLELEGVEDRTTRLAPFVIAEVLEAKQHPDADRLRVCRVFDGSQEHQVVCGAPNARTGMRGVFAPEGSHIPGSDMVLKPTKIRGVESSGMLVSERELGLSDAHTGIIDLAADAPVGQNFAAWAGLDDPVIDIAITPNRGDCLGVRGVARDLAAAGIGTLKDLDTRPVPGSFPSPIGIQRAFPEGEEAACPLFVGRYFRGVKNGPSPKWLQDRLLSIGLRPISTLVDITNLITHDLCRPLHVFDADKLTGDIVLRFGQPGESLDCLDNKTYAFDGTMIAVADQAGAQAFAGIIGGAPTGCTEETVNVFLEVALFDPIRTAITGRKLGIHSDARFRFERGLDGEFVLPATEIASRLILELCGGEASEVVVSGAVPARAAKQTLRPERVAELGGIDVPRAEQKRLLTCLGFEVEEAADGSGAFEALPPSWRNDIVEEACLVEEVLRIHGYDRIPIVPLPRPNTITQPARTLPQRRHAWLRRCLAARGLMEAVTFSFMSSAHTPPFGGGKESLTLLNPISADLDEMRPSILPNLLLAAGRNSDRGFGDCALFEIGPQFAGPRPEEQTLVAAGLRLGRTGPRHWQKPGQGVDVFQAKADALAGLAACGAPVDSLQVIPGAPSWYHPGRSGRLCLGPKTVLGWFGEVHPQVLKALDVKGPVVGFELFPDAIPQPKTKGSGRTRPALDPSPFQPLSRDFAFIVDADVPADKLLRAAKGAEKTLISEVGVFDVYTGTGVPEGKKSLALSVTLQPREKTLTDEEIEAVAAKIVAHVAKQTGAELRA